jgi:exodeoxyribonuclease III
VYAPNGRQVDSPFYAAKLLWFDKLARWINKTVTAETPAVIGGDFNVAPEDTSSRLME